MNTWCYGSEETATAFTVSPCIILQKKSLVCKSTRENMAIQKPTEVLTCMQPLSRNTHTDRYRTAFSNAATPQGIIMCSIRKSIGLA